MYRYLHKKSTQYKNKTTTQPHHTQETAFRSRFFFLFREHNPRSKIKVMIFAKNKTVVATRINVTVFLPSDQY